MRIPRLCFTLLALATGLVGADGAKITPEIEKRISEACPTSAPAKPQKARKVLVFSRCEGFKHGCIPIAEKAMVILGERSGAYTATVNNEYSAFEPAALEQFDAIILNNTTKLAIPEGAPRKALLDFVRNGKGIVGIHGAVDNFDKPAFPEALAMMGGVFHGHPWGAGGTWRFKVEEKHPVVANLEAGGFSVHDEIYQYDQKITNRANVRMLVTLDFSDPTTANANKDKQCRTDGDYPVVWVRAEGKGRVFVNGFGHNNELFWDKTMLALNLAGIQYALGDLKGDDAPVPKK